MANREKYLGQFFSGKKIAELLYLLLDTSDIHTLIDPMCGIGDMFHPFESNWFNIHGNEIDPLAYKECKRVFPQITLKNYNCFSADAFQKYLPEGYDLVITNPPYIRYQSRDKAKEIVGDSWMNFENIKAQLNLYCSTCSHISPEEKELFTSCISKISGLADMAVPCWILCLMLIKPGGQLAIVMPEAWLNREYSKPVKDLLKETFELTFVLNDANSVWFSGKAQVKTTLLIGKRRRPEDNNHFCYVDILKGAMNNNSLIGNITHPDLKNLFSKGGAEDNLYYSTVRLQNDFLDSDLSSSWLSFLSTMPYLSDYKIQLGQGLRTGANFFFYVDANIFKGSSLQYLLDTIQSQSNLSGVSIKNGTSKLLFIENAATPEDLGYIFPRHLSHFKCLPEDICSYIYEGAHTKKGDICLPMMSSVKTNISSQTDTKPPRFWYMLPPLKDRHIAPLFIPRVNGGIPLVRYNPNRLVVDANFSTIWLNSNSQLSVYSTLALLNSSLCTVQYEELGTVMGGGALKLDAAQLRKVKVPLLTSSEISKLDKYGKTIVENNTLESHTLDLIDRLLLKAAGVDNISTAQKAIKERLQYLIRLRRNENKRS